MNYREEPHLPAGARRTLCVAALLLVPALGLEQGHAGPRQGTLYPRCAEPTPYLAVVGATALRLAEVPPPPDLVTRPASVGPPVPALSPGETAVATANASAAKSVTAVLAPSTPTVSVPAPASDMTTVPPADRAPAPILPDTARSVIHAEDFLPYFEIPGTARHPGDVTLITPGVPSGPTPPPVPPSSATYTQSPR